MGVGAGFNRVSRRVLPRSLLGRSLLIVLIPLLVTQGVALQLFYGTYLGLISRRLSASVVDEIALVSDLLARSPPTARGMILDRARIRTQLAMVWHPGEKLSRAGSNHVLGPMDDDLIHAVELSIDRPYFVNWARGGHVVEIEIGFPDGVLEVASPRKRLDVGPVWLFVAWAFGSSLILFGVASVFMRNQVRAIRRLARAAELFGVGRDPGPIRPEGAQEVRQAAIAFNRMQERVTRFVAQRTAVLAGVSHDLRTPLTRMRLTLAMVPQSGSVSAETLAPDIADMVADVAEMERLIGGYLSFARGEGAEAPVLTDLAPLMEEVASAARRAGGRVASVTLPRGATLLAWARPDAMRRVLANLTENARRYGGALAFTGGADGRQVWLAVDDDGPGIAPDRRADALEGRGEGEGRRLGLRIARDIMHAHGGSIALETSPLGGLRVLLRLPSAFGDE